MSNKSTDFTYPVSLTSCGSNVSFNFVMKAHVKTNKQSVYRSLTTGSFSNILNKVAVGTYDVTIPSSWFRRQNAYATIQIDTYDKNGTFVSGSFSHSILLFHSSYKNYLYNCSIPDRTYPGETCTINVQPPKDLLNGQYYDIDINYHRDVGRQVIATNRTKTGAFNFVVPALAINSSLTVRIVTKDKNGRILGELPQSIKIEKPNITVSSTSSSTSIKAPQIYLPDNYTLTLSEGENVKIKGDSENINDYMII